jgi:hypothetical protein
MYIVECRQLRLVDGELIYMWDEWTRCLEKEDAEKVLRKYQSVSKEPFRITYKPEESFRTNYKPS